MSILKSKINKESSSYRDNFKRNSTLVEELAKKAVEKKITKVYFDRGFYKYHGRIKTLAETLRKKGMEF